MHGNFDTMGLSGRLDNEGRFGWPLKEKKPPTSPRPVFHSNASEPMTTEKGRLNIIHYNYQRLFKTTRKKTSQILSSTDTQITFSRLFGEIEFV